MEKHKIKPFGYRPDPEVRDALQRAAKQFGRSMNSQLDQYVKRGLQQDGVEVAQQK